jgi:hypothetical protein
VRRDRRGAALLEVLAAVAILGTAGVALLELATGHARATADARERESALADEERLLTAHALLGRVDLEQRLGARAVGPYIVRVQRPEAALFRIAIARRSSPNVEDLVTIVYHEPADAP